MHGVDEMYQLSNGVKSPSIGFGTWQTPEGDVALESVKYAIRCGYRHIDTAQGYGNEASVGRDALVTREIRITCRSETSDGTMC